MRGGHLAAFEADRMVGPKRSLNGPREYRPRGLPQAVCGALVPSTFWPLIGGRFTFHATY